MICAWFADQRPGAEKNQHAATTHGRHQTQRTKLDETCALKRCVTAVSNTTGWRFRVGVLSTGSFSNRSSVELLYEGHLDLWQPLLVVESVPVMLDHSRSFADRSRSRSRPEGCTLTARVCMGIHGMSWCSIPKLILNWQYLDLWHWDTCMGPLQLGLHCFLVTTLSLPFL